MEKTIELSERVAVLEHKMENHKDDVKELTEIVKELSSKINDLLTLKDKGMGAFWLAGLVLGSGVLGLITLAFSWFKGGF